MKMYKCLLIILLGGVGIASDHAQSVLPTPSAPKPEASEPSRATQAPDTSQPQIPPELESNAREMLRDSLEPNLAADPQTDPVQIEDGLATPPKTDQPVPAGQANAAPVAVPATVASPTPSAPTEPALTIDAREVESPLAESPEPATQLAPDALAESQPSPDVESAPMDAEQEALARSVLEEEWSKPCPPPSATMTDPSTFEDGAPPSLSNALLRDFLGRKGRSMFNVGGGLWVAPPPPVTYSSPKS